MHQRKRNRRAFRPCVREASLEDRLVLSAGAGGAPSAPAATPALVGPIAAGPPSLLSTGTSFGSTGTDVLTIGTTTVTGAISQFPPTLATSSFQDVSALASEPQYVLRIPDLTPVNLPTGPLPGKLGTPDSVIGYWGYNDDFANGFYQYVSSTEASTPFFMDNPNEGYHLLSETPASLNAAPAATAQGGPSGISPDALVEIVGSPPPRGASVFTAIHGNVGNSAVRKKAPGRTGLQTLSPRYGGAGTIDLVKGPTPTGPKAKGGPVTGPTRKGTKPRPPTSDGTKTAPPTKQDAKPMPRTKKPAEPAKPVRDSTRTGPATQDDSRAGPLRSQDDVDRGTASQGAAYPESHGETEARGSRAAQSRDHREAPAGPGPDLS